MTLILGHVDRFLERTEPFRHRGADRIANRAGPAVEFKRCRGEETTAGKNFASEVIDPRSAQRQQARVAAIDFQHRTKHFIDESLLCFLDRRELQLFLRTEVREESAL